MKMTEVEIMTKNRILLLVLFVVLAVSTFAENVTVQTAQRAAETFLNSKRHSNIDIHLVDFAEKESFPNLYIFGNEHCFVIIAANDAVHPVLGYSVEEGFETEIMPKNTYEWLKAYDEEIAFVSESRWEADDEISSEWYNLLDGIGLTPKSRNSVNPLLKTKWNQNAPFNDLCPADSAGPNGHCYTGCVATVMAQIMNYWEHPVKGSGSHTYTPSNHPEYGSQYANFGTTTYDWDNMKDYYSRGYTDEEALAVATLMYHCGVALSSEYGPNSTGARLLNVPQVLSYRFKYSSGMVYRTMSSLNSDSLWIDMLKQELDLGRPIPYRGTMDEGNAAHAFVCDGYDENDFFHFNWGWSGRYNGFFMIGALNPQRNDMGNPSNRGFNASNSAIFNCYPKTPSITPPSDINATINGRNVTITWSNVNNASHYRVYRDGTLIVNNIQATSYTDSYVTYGPHSYYVKSVKSDGTMSLKSSAVVADIHFTGPMPTNLQATVSGNNVNLSWQAPASEDVILQYGTGNATNSFGYDEGTYWAHRYPISTLSDYAGMAIEKVAFYSHNAGNYTISVYKGDIAYPTELLHQQSYNALADNWQDIVFSTPIVIDYTKDLWIVFYSETNSPASYCPYSSSEVEDASLYSQTGQRWEVMSDRSWLIKTYITNGTYTYKLYRDGNVVAANISNSSYTNSNVPVGFFDYYVTTNYFGSESDPSNPIRIRVGNPPCSVSATADPSYGGTVAGDGTYNYGSTCTLTATPTTGYDFVKWTKDGTQVSTNTSYSFTVTEAANLVAHFQLKSFTINASANPSNGGSVNGSGTYNYGQTCVLTATPAIGYDFISWTKNGTQVSTNSSYSFTVTEAANFVAHFQLQSFAINTSSDPYNGGTINGGGTYYYGQTCTLTATPSTGFDFVNWTKNGSQVSTNSSYSFTVTEEANYVAHFQLQSFTINASSNPNNSGTISGSGTYNYGQTCTLTATPNPGYTFLRWTKNGTQVSSNEAYSFTVTEAASFVAHFQLNNYVISISSSPSNGGTVSGGGAFHYGDNCTVTATTNYGFSFINWTENGNPVSNQSSYTFTITSDRNLEANFTTQNYIITAMANPNEGGTVSGSGGYNYGDNCTLSATANAGYTFQRWTKNGTQVSTSPSYSFTVTESATFTAHFTMVDYTINVEANPSEGGSVNGGGTFNYVQTCTVHASPNIGFEFIKWTENGTQVSDQPDYSFTVTGNRNLVAHFIPMSYEITAEADPEIGGIVIGAGIYAASGTATLSAVPNDSYLFQNWTEGNTIVSESTTYTFTVDHSRHLVAHFFHVDGIDEKTETVELFPNPASDNLCIKGNDIKRISIYNSLGQLVEDREVEQQDMVMLNVSNYNTGTYFIRIELGHDIVSKVFVKKN